MELLKTTVMILCAFAGPILCYIAVYGLITVINFIYLQIKAYRFRKRMQKRQDKNEITDSREGEIQ